MLVPVTGDYMYTCIVSKAAARPTSAGLRGLKGCFCPVDGRMETRLGYIRLDRPESMEGEVLRCHLFSPLTIKG